MTKLPARYMCYDGQPSDDGPALDVGEVAEWCEFVLRNAEVVPINKCAEYLRKEIRQLRGHLLREENNEDNKAKCDDN